MMNPSDTLLSLLLESLISIFERCCTSLSTKAFALSRTLLSPDQSQHHWVAGGEFWAQGVPVLGAAVVSSFSVIQHRSVAD